LTLNIGCCAVTACKQGFKWQPGAGDSQVPYRWAQNASMACSPSNNRSVTWIGLQHSKEYNQLLRWLSLHRS
jgi:hypothetical protein